MLEPAFPQDWQAVQAHIELLSPQAGLVFVADQDCCHHRREPEQLASHAGQQPAQALESDAAEGTQEGDSCRRALCKPHQDSWGTADVVWQCRCMTKVSRGTYLPALATMAAGFSFQGMSADQVRLAQCCKFSLLCAAEPLLLTSIPLQCSCAGASLGCHADQCWR